MNIYLSEIILALRSDVDGLSFKRMRRCIEKKGWEIAPRAMKFNLDSLIKEGNVEERGGIFFLTKKGKAIKLKRLNPRKEKKS